jgi:hypothetical protein
MPRLGIWHCIYFTAYQPLLTLAIIVIPTFRQWDFAGSIAADVGVFGMVGVLLLTVFHEYQGRDEYVQQAWYRRIIWITWVLYLFLVLWVAHASEDSPLREVPNQGYPIHTKIMTLAGRRGRAGRPLGGRTARGNIRDVAD